MQKQGDRLEESASISARIERGETVRRALDELGALRRDLRIDRLDGRIFLPITDECVLPKMKELDDTARVEKHFFEPFEKRAKSYKELANVPDALRSELPTSFDVIGDIAIIKLPEALLPYKEEVARAILEAQRAVHVVALDRGVKGELRVRDVKVIAGENRTETTYTEYGIRLKLDVAKVYFSPRLANERYRVASISSNERVLDMFAGVGPFSILIAKHSKPKVVFSIDINPDAIKYLKENIELNKAKMIVPFVGDVRKVVQNNREELGQIDRVIMNLPHSAYEFLDVALGSAKKGATIHYYEIMDREKIDDRKEELVNIARSLGRRVRILGTRVVRQYSPSEDHFAVDILVED